MAADGRWVEATGSEWSDVIVAAMKLGGVDNLFFVSGSEITFYQEAIAKAQARGRPAPRLITMTHESVALNAALGNAMVRNQPSAVAVHVDAGTLHMGAAIHTGWRGGYPVLLTAGAGPRAFPGSARGARDAGIQWFQEPRDQGGIVRQYTKADHRLEHQDNSGLMISRLLQLAMSEPTGPVYLTIPRESAMLPLSDGLRFPTRDQLGLARPSCPDSDDARTLAKWLVAADNPVIYTGSAGRDPQAAGELASIADFLAIPVMDSPQADRLNLSTAHFAYGTGPRTGDADAILVLSDVAPFMPGEVMPEARVAWVGPDPVVGQTKTMEFRADLRISASVTSTLRSIYEASSHLLDNAALTRIADRRAHLKERKRLLETQAEDAACRDISEGKLTGRVAAFELGRALEPDSIVLNDGVSNASLIRQYARRTLPGTYFRSGSSAGGWGAGASVGVKLAAQRQDVVHATGDGYFMFGSPLSALWAAGHHRSAYLTVVFVNGSYSTGTTSLKSSYPGGYGEAAGYVGGVFAPAPDFAKLAEAAHGYGETVTDPAELEPALRRGLGQTRAGVPAVIAVALHPA